VYITAKEQTDEPTLSADIVDDRRIFFAAKLFPFNQKYCAFVYNVCMINFESFLLKNISDSLTYSISLNVLV